MSVVEDPDEIASRFVVEEGDATRQATQIQILQRLVGMRVQQPPPMPNTHPIPLQGVPHRPESCPRAPGRAQLATERHGTGHRTTGPPQPHRIIIFGAQPCVPLFPGRQRPRQHVLFHAAQVCQELASGCVQQHLGVGPRASALMARRVVAPLPARPQRFGFQPVAARDAADQRRSRLPPQRAGVAGHSTMVSCSAIRAGVRQRMSILALPTTDGCLTVRRRWAPFRRRPTHSRSQTSGPRTGVRRCGLAPGAHPAGSPAPRSLPQAGRWRPGGGRG